MIQDIPDWKTAIKVATDIVLGVNHKTHEPESFQEVSAIMGKATEMLLLSKNEKYGKGNMLSATKFNVTVEQGLMIRENDKTERILNHFSGIDLGKEGLLESFGDKAGYSEIGMMLQMKTKDGKSWYEIPITKED